MVLVSRLGLFSVNAKEFLKAFDTIEIPKTYGVCITALQYMQCDQAWIKSICVLVNKEL